VVYTLLSKIQKGHLGSPELSSFVLFKNMENRAEQSLALAYISLYAVSLQVTQVAYFRLRTGDLKSGIPLEDGKVCYH